MATFMEMLNQGIGGLNTPLGQLGTQMLLNSGYMPNNPSGGARMGQALAGMSEMQRQQALQQYRQQQMTLLEQQQQAHVQAAQQKADQQAQYQQRLQDPNFLASLSPTARQFAQLGVDPRELIRATAADNLQTHRQAQLAQSQAQFDERQAHQGSGGGNPSMPKLPTPRQFIDRPLEGGLMQRLQYNPDTQGYDAFGEPFSPHSPRGAVKAAKAAKVDSLDNVMSSIMGAPAEEPGLESLPGGAPLASYAPPSTPAPMVAAGANPSAAREGMRVPGQPKIATPVTKAQYDALPVGAQYVDPVSGKTATKKAR